MAESGLVNILGVLAVGEGLGELVAGQAGEVSPAPLSCLHYFSCSSTPSAFQSNPSGHLVLALDRAP